MLLFTTTCRHARVALAGAALLAMAVGAQAQDDSVVARVNGIDIRQSDVALAEEDLGNNIPNMPPDAVYQKFRNRDWTVGPRNARHNLRTAITARDPSFEFDAALLRRIPQPAIEIGGTGTLAGAKRSIRSLHVYSSGTETVVDCIGPTSDSAAFNSTICEPVLDSLTVG